MTISELYAIFDDVQDFTKINVYGAVKNGHFMDNKLLFSGRFSDMSIELTQENVVRFSYDYSQDTLFVII